MDTISLQQDWPTDAIVLDVRLADDAKRERLPGAVNICVFEVTFLPRIAELRFDPGKPIIVYGFGPHSLEADMAVEKLTRAGHTNVRLFRGGMAAWRDAGRPTEGEGSPAAAPVLADGIYTLDPAASRLEWLGRNLLNKHWGTIGLRSGSCTVRHGQAVEGRAVIDMNDIRCTDLEGSDLHDVLINHLRSDDFFDAERFPEAVFDLEFAKRVEGSAAGSPNLRVRGRLTLKGVTHPIEFAASGGMTPEGTAAAQAHFAIDRTRWNVAYGSGKLFEHLGGHLVNDEIEFQLRLVARAPEA